jgi:adenosine kinase
MGEMGSRIYTPEGEIKIPAAKPKQVVDPTGAGDAYRGGLISGLLRGKDLKESARMGSVCASFAVECYGTQSYSFTEKELEERLKTL